ncbi:unnamed protein product [Orchesella dallaii]|uniref:Uncharacterized protein n=1 Tax=Orchesella dallaii TaxID=48710 RepID=A0ABP1RA95_9HEXA
MESSCNYCCRNGSSRRNISTIKRPNRGRLSITVTSVLLVIITSAVFALDLSPTYDDNATSLDLEEPHLLFPPLFHSFLRKSNGVLTNLTAKSSHSRNSVVFAFGLMQKWICKTE